MFLTILIIVICFACFLFALTGACAIRRIALRIAFIIYTIAFFALGSYFLVTLLRDVAEPTKSAQYSSESAEPAQYGPEKKNYLMSFYVQDGAENSETYYLEVTEHDTYKFCCFSEDASQIIKFESPAEITECDYSYNNVPCRAEIYYNNGEPILYRLFLPGDGNTVQLDTGND